MKRRAALLLAALVSCTAASAAEQDNGIAAAMNDLQVRVERDLAYGAHPLQRLDAYLPGTARGPVLLVVHGGAWAVGDKRSPSLLPKVRHWTALGYVVVSANYRLLPDADPMEQARDVARALAFVQKQASAWGADPAKVVLLGHSAGAHLVALLDAAPGLAYAQGARPWRGTVSLDSAALNIAAIMRGQHAALYDRAFGSDPQFWTSVSPLQSLTREAPPLLAVCSTRSGSSCAQSEAFRRRAEELGVRVQVERVDLRHADTSGQLGLPGAYTESVSRWISSIL